MKRLLFFLIVAVVPAVAGEAVELTGVSPRDAKITAALHISLMEAEVTMRGALAETKATLTLTMDADPMQKMEGRLVFPLPPGCLVTGAALDIGEIMRPASLTFKATAKQAYDAVVSRMLDPTLIQLRPDGRVSVQVFPFTGGVPRKLRLEFFQTVLPGTMWEFPLRFVEPVKVHLKTDAPFVMSDIKQGEFNGGEEWRVPMPGAGAKLVRANPDGAGHWHFQTVIPAGEPAEPPRHLLLLADVSLLHAKRDAAAERTFLERVFQKMQTGRVTLATFSTALHSQTEYAVQDGKCGELLAALEALSYDGAPRPGAVNVSGIPADLTLVLSTLAAPMGGGNVPRLPAAAPVWVLDSVSPAPSAMAVLLAGESGGMVFDPQAAPAISFRRRPVVTSEKLTGLSFYPLPAGGWLMTGELSAGHGEFTAGGKTMIVTKDTDAVAGAMIARQRARERFARLAAASGGLLREEMLPTPNTAPFLTEATAFIVLEKASDYQRWKIPLPPDMERDGAQVHDWQEKSEREDFVEFDRALRRPAGTRGEPSRWFNQLRGYEKRAAVGIEMENTERFRQHRKPVSAGPDETASFLNHPDWKELLAKAERGIAVMSRLAERYGKEPRGEAADLIRQAREQQQNRVRQMDWLMGMVFSEGMGSGGGPGIDPITFGDLLQRGGSYPAADPFAGPSADAFAASGADAGWSGGESAAAPFLVDAEPAANSGAGAGGTAQTSGGPPQNPQTFGGSGGWPWGGDIFDRNADGEDHRGPFSYYKRGAEDSPPDAGGVSHQILARPTALHRDGKKPEAIRALSNLAIPGQQYHALLRVLAWVLLEWGEPALALEVLAHAERKFGSSDTAVRDLALAELAAGRRDEALSQFRRASHQVARRDAAGLDGRMSAALRIVVECAGAEGDADLEIEGPDYELCSWRNPLPAFGGALSFDGKGEAPEDFVLPSLPAHPLKVRVRSTGGKGPQTLRLTVIEEWGRPGEKRRIFLLSAVQPGVTNVTVIDAAK